MKVKKSLAILSASILLTHLAFLAPFVEAQTYTVPRGTMLRLVLKNNLSTEYSKVGDPFTAELVEDVKVEGRTVLPAGAIVDGAISKMESPKRLAGLRGRASIVLRFDRIRTGGMEYPIVASLLSVHDPADGAKQQEKVKGEGEVQAKSDTKGTVTKGAIGVAAGTVLGAIFGSVSKGLVLGSIGGAAAILAPKGKDVTLSTGTGLQIRLDRDLESRVVS